MDEDMLYIDGERLQAFIIFQQQMTCQKKII